jgi:hypothetical protein
MGVPLEGVESTSAGDDRDHHRWYEPIYGLKLACPDVSLCLIVDTRFRHRQLAIHPNTSELPRINLV